MWPRSGLGEHADPEWFERYGRRIEEQRLPEGKEAREGYLKTVGADGMRLVAHIADPRAPQSLKELVPRSKYCAGSGSSTTRRATQRYGLSTQKRCPKPLAASNPPTTRWRLATLPSAR